MPAPKDPTAALRKLAASLPGAVEGTSCNQTSYRIGKDAFLFIGPGTKGQGFKAMFKLSKSLPQARDLASSEPDRFQAGAGHWVTVRFSAQAPLQRTLGDKWLKESHRLTADGSGSKASAAPAGEAQLKQAASKAASTKATGKVAAKKSSKRAPSKAPASRKKVSKAPPKRKTTG